MSVQLLIRISALFYGLSFVTECLFRNRHGATWFFLVSALVVNAAAVVWRYLVAWPMLPMYMGPELLLLFLGFFVPLIRTRQKGGPMARRLILALLLIIALMVVCFPKDFYLPFLQSQTVYAHLFLLLGGGGEACFLVSAAWALAGLLGARRPRSGHESSADHQPSPLKHSLNWTILGFALWTLSMFAGEIWSYRGWGTPVVWEDPTITTTMATWFFYVCLLHLHLTRSWTAHARGVYAAAGTLVILGLNCIPELGPFRWPF